MLGFPSQRLPHVRILSVDLNTVDPVQLARSLAQDRDIPSIPLCIEVDCQSLRCLRTHGVGHFVTGLLHIRRAGVPVRLRNVSRHLHRLLQLLKLHALFDIDRHVPVLRVPELQPAA
ncbi:hypothetical protein [Solirubrum puertoriconensis]|uniref:STAS domain-containing protein n=1 Tax=Solirubrum puertoriconensis TaxID=1751427 RepID=A0A9X0L3K4_SOLP1|nr:hypothetical protein [Solirubrum puertoriconensis]KUG06529.1 hypothetical protein ASU33_04040 [Solirubrum puertoriconensis]